MNEGVKILLERMKTNPEEFIVSEGYPYEVGSGSKWHKLIESHKLYLNPEDNKVLEEALNGLMQQRFTERVMKELLAPEEDDSLGKPWYSKQGNITLSGGTTQGGFTLNTNPQGQATWATTTATGTLSADSIMLGNTSINEVTLSQILQAHREVRQKQKKHKTLFGKLFNYT